MDSVSFPFELLGESPIGYDTASTIAKQRDHNDIDHERPIYNTKQYVGLVLYLLFYDGSGT